MTTTHEDSKERLLLALAAEIEAEMRRLTLWSEAPPLVSRPKEAFGADVLSFEDWLQRVFIPNLRQAALSRNYPLKSSVAVAAVRNLDGVEGVEHLIELLAQVDKLIERT